MSFAKTWREERVGSELGCGGREVLSRAGRCVLAPSRNANLTGNGSLREGWAACCQPLEK